MSSTRQLLALACAASLFAACAAIVPNWNRDYPLGQCDRIMRGRSGTKLPIVHVNLKRGLNVVNVSDECSKEHMFLVGQRLTACSWNQDQPPKLILDPWPSFSPISANADNDVSSIDIQLFCKKECSSIIRGKQSTLKISQKEVVNPAGINSNTISNDCKLIPKMDLVGEVVTACSDVTPTLTMDPWPAYSPVVVSGGDTTLPTTVNVNQYCEMKP